MGWEAFCNGRIIRPSSETEPIMIISIKTKTESKSKSCPETPTETQPSESNRFRLQLGSPLEKNNSVKAETVPLVFQV
jgi:hypothetical protein